MLKDVGADLIEKINFKVYEMKLRQYVDKV